MNRFSFLDHSLDFWLGELDRTWTVRAIRARVVDVVRETADTRTFVLRPNRHWRGHRAGQHVTVEVELEGVRVRRCFSVSSAPGGRDLAITVKRTPGGRVSRWLHERCGIGAVLGLSPAAGDFVLPAPLPARLLFLSGGSGITPVMSMVRDLVARGALADAVFVHHARSLADVIFAGELAALAARHPGLRLVIATGPFDEAALQAAVPDLAERESFLCGPTGMMERATALWAQVGASARLHQERFGGPLPTALPVDGAPVRAVLGDGRALTVRTSASLLVGLEQAGERPRHGCRIGICGTCKTRKRSGTVRNLVTGARSSEPDELIQLCITAPCADVELSL